MKPKDKTHGPRPRTILCATIAALLSGGADAAGLAVYPGGNEEVERTLELDWQPVCRTAAPRYTHNRSLSVTSGCVSQTCQQDRERIACTEIIAGTHDLFTAWNTRSCGGWSDNGSCAPINPDHNECCGEDGGTGSGGGDGSCFLTTAVATMRGEPDDGPTLTALRTLRDTFMQATPERRALVTEYYDIAPDIMAAIPAQHREWKHIADTIDACIRAIDAGAPERAATRYAAMVTSLKARWLQTRAPQPQENHR